MLLNRIDICSTVGRVWLSAPDLSVRINFVLSWKVEFIQCHVPGALSQTRPTTARGGRDDVPGVPNVLESDPKRTTKPSFQSFKVIH